MKTPMFFLSFAMLFISCSTANKYKDPVKSFAEVNGTKLYYEVHGSGEPIIFVHGNFGDVRHWDFQVEPFSQNYKVVRYDVRGYGKSAVPDSAIAYRDYDDLRALMDYLGIEKAHICGWSMGSGIAVDFALAYPDRVISLIPIGPWPNGYGGGKYTSVATDSMFTIFGKVFSLISSEGPKSATDYWWAGDHEIKSTVVKPRTLDSLLRIGYEYSWWGFLNPNKRDWYSPQAVEVLHTIKTPTMIVTAQHDIQACKESAALMHRQIQNSQLVSIDNAGHCMNMDNPEAFNRIIVDFISSL
jgi:pimeloyl-ACP methyl ester carboxylesterase